MRESSKIEKRIRLDCLGRGPELIGYMTMSIRLSPSLTRAITFAAKNMEGPIGSGLKRIIWNVYTRKYHSVEESFTATATEWGKWNDDLKRALFEVKSSTLEATEEDRERSLNKTMDTVLSGTRKRMEEFASSLSTPTTILFALGILLPMILGAMLPMVSLGGLDLSYQAASSGAMNQGGIHPALIVLMMDVVFPATALTYALHILSGWPGSALSSDYNGVRTKRMRLVVMMTLGAMLAVLGTLSLDTFGSYLIVWSVALPTSIHLTSSTSRRRKERGKVRKLEEEFPDALFQLGTRISEGVPPEKATLDTACSMNGTEIAELLRHVHHRTMVFGLPLEKALFGERGILLDIPSATIQATMKSFVEIASKDSVKAGQMIIRTAEHLKDLQRLKEENRRKLRTSTESIKMTSLFFSPVVMGITLSLYELLVDTFSRVGPTDIMMPGNLFHIVLGVYIILIASISMHFVSFIQAGPDRVERDHRVGLGVLLSAATFTFSSILGGLIVV